MKVTWQEKLARWMLKPKPPQKLNEKLSHWWFMLFVGIVCCIPIFNVGRKLRSHTYEYYLEHSGEACAEKFADIVSLGYFLLGVGILLFFAVCGLIYEERKGYQRIISKLESKAEQDDGINSVTSLRDSTS